MLAEAIAELREALGTEKIRVDDGTLARYARTTFPPGTRPCAVVYPVTTEEVQSCMRVAARHKIGVYPISRGCNWGYGDACAPEASSVILDMSRMNRILEVNTELGYAVLEAGVSQRQLYDHLQTITPRFWFDCSGAGDNASLVGNTLDRGFGHTRYGDHFLTTCGMEIVLADGRVLDTGYGHYETARAGRVYRYGVGPALDGLFCQSNFGIVTKIGLWLMPEPEAFNFFFVQVKANDLECLIDRLRPLRMSGVLNTAIHIGNDLRIISGSGRYPWKEAGGRTPLPAEVRAQLCRENMVYAWNAGGSITGTAAHVRATKKQLRTVLGDLGKIVFVGDRKVALGKFAAACLGAVGLGKRLRRRMADLIPNYGLLKGIPTNEPLLGPQWRLRHPPDGPCDPLDAGCGVAWVSPVLPMTGADARRVLGIVEPIFSKFGFECLVTFTLINERAMIAVINVAFDQTESEEAARAAQCYDALLEAVIADGYYPYRATLHGMGQLAGPDDVFWQVASQIKRALDPDDLIARGRYVPPLTKE
jgi:4-cresol dehydrogenase (hydroxylating)